MPMNSYEIGVGGLSNPSKMKRRTDGLICKCINLPPQACNVGSKLIVIEGSVCEKCYGTKGFYVMPSSQKAMQRRLDALQTNPYWANDMAHAIGKCDLFRYQDNGDIQGMSHLIKIVAVAHLRPDVRFWLPTKEYAVVSDYYKAGGTIPDNLIIRLSAPMRNQHLPMRAGHSSMVTTTDNVPYGTFICESLSRGGICGDCTACWDKKYLRIAYRYH